MGAVVTTVPYKATTGAEIELYVRIFNVPKDPLLAAGPAASYALGETESGSFNRTTSFGTRSVNLGSK